MNPPYRPYTQGNPFMTWYPVLPQMLLARCVDRGGFVYVSFRFKVKENLPRRGDLFLGILTSK